MKQLSAVLMLLLVSLPAALVAQATSGPAGRHIFYRVTSVGTPKGGKNAKSATIYLLGSVHLLPPEAGALPPEVDSAFEHAKFVAFETSLDSLEKRGRELLAKAQFTGDTTLRSSLSASAIPKVDSILKSYGSSFEQVAKFKPWFVSLALQQAIAQGANFRAEYGFDSQLNGRAREANKPRRALESVDDQLGLFDRMTLAQQETELLDTKPPAAALRELQTMKTMWQTGDASGLDSLTHADESSATAAITGAVLTSRNQKWLPEIEQWLRGGEDGLVVVGAAHLVGKDGLVDLLRAKGYRVEQR